MRPEIQVRPLAIVPRSELSELKRCSFGKNGWMYGFVDQILEGKNEWAPRGYKLSYNRAHVLVARTEDGNLMGWALVRHPSRRIVIKHWTGKTYYGGRRPDFNVYVKNKYRKFGVAKDLLIVTYSNWGRVDAYPHDKKSNAFYLKHKRFVVANDTSKWSGPQFKAKEVW